MATTDDLFPADSVAAAIDQIHTADHDEVPSVETIRDILVAFERFIHENDWDSYLNTINEGHSELFHLSAEAIVFEAAYESFSIPLEEVGYDDEDIVRTIQRVHRDCAEAYTDRDIPTDVYPIIVTPPAEDLL